MEKIVILVLAAFLLNSCQNRTNSGNYSIETINDLKSPVTIVNIVNSYKCEVILKDGNGKLIYLSTCVFNDLPIGSKIK